MVVEDGIKHRNGVIKRFAVKRRTGRNFWGQVLGMKSAASLPDDAQATAP